MTLIEQGYFKIARKLYTSEIWQTKPSWWLKVWVYLIGYANHSDNRFPRGTNFLNHRLIWKACCLDREGVKEESVDNVIRWLKSTGQITTQKTTRGFHLTICNYELYQNGINYGNDAENDAKNDIGTTQKRRYKQQCKNEKKKNIYMPPTLDEVKDYCAQRNSSIDPEQFFHHYESTGWIKANGQLIGNWKSTVITWEKNHSKINPGPVSKMPPRFGE